jgi:hypothetical protein
MSTFESELVAQQAKSTNARATVDSKPTKQAEPA